MRRLVVIALAVTVVLSLAVPAAAVIWGTPDGDAHPQVGLIVFDADFGEGPQPAWRCSGTLISDTVVLTAGHCTFGAAAARVWFESEVDDPAYPFGGGDSIEGTPHAHPAYDDFATFPNTSDVGVVVLDEPVTGVSYGRLPEAGRVDRLARGPARGTAGFTIVGYGLQGTVPELQADLVRYRGNPRLVELESALTDGWNIHLSSNRGKRNTGGACFGDSGGPAFIDRSLTIAGVGSFVLNQHCVGAGYYYRVDTDHTLDWVTGFLQ